MADSLGVSGTSDPYTRYSYTAQANDKNTITMTGFFQLLATQLQNQDMTNPMDNSEIMAQMTQMAMVQAMTTMTDTMKNSSAINTQTYAAGLVGQEVTMAVTQKNIYGQGMGKVPNPFGTPETDEDGDKDDSGEDGSVGKPEESGKPDTEPDNGLAKTRNALI